jgi:coatomer subunit alpha
LAYLTAKTNGLDELAEEILEAAGLSESDIDDVPSFGQSTLKPPPVVVSIGDLTWPSLSTGESYFDRAMANGGLEGGDVQPSPYANGDAAAATTSAALDDWAKEEEEPDIDPEEGGWELDADGADFEHAEDVDEDAVPEGAEELGSGSTPGVSETEHWVRNSPLAADHVAAGSFESAMTVSRILPEVLRASD